jgi:hypothetical protein
MRGRTVLIDTGDAVARQLGRCWRRGGCCAPRGRFGGRAPWRLYERQRTALAPAFGLLGIDPPVDEVDV